MSELTRCNYCNVQSYKAKAKERGVELILVHHSFGEWRGWWSARFSNEDEPFSYMMEITRDCVC